MIPRRNKVSIILFDSLPTKHTTLFFSVGMINIYHIKGLTEPKIAVVVSKKHTKTAVGRHVLKRVFFNAIAPLLNTLQPVVYVIYPKKGILYKDIHIKELTEEFSKVIFG